MSYLKKILIFIRLVDVHDGLLSITNVALFVVLYKLFMVQTASITDIGALFIGLANYNVKKYINKQTLIGNIVNEINPAIMKEENAQS